MAAILVAEDDVQILRVLSMWLSRNGHEVLEARDGEQAIEALSGRLVDLIVTDVNMPRLDGLGLIRWVRESKRDTPIVVLSSRCDQASMSAELSIYGINVHPKPFSPSRLLQEIDRLLATHGARPGESIGDAPETAAPRTVLSMRD